MLKELFSIGAMLSSNIDEMINGLEEKAYSMYRKSLTLPRKKKKKLKKEAMQMFSIALYAKETFTFKL